MELWINILFAWIALILSFFLVIIWLLRVINKKKKIVWIQRTNRALRRHHKLVGLLLISTALVHGLFSSDKVFSLNWGTANWVVSILLGLSWLLRKKLNLKNWWMYIHRILTVLFIGLLVVHIVSVGGFILDDIIAGRIGQPPVIDEVAEQPAETQEIPAAEPTTAPTQSPTPTPDNSQPVTTETPAPVEPTAGQTRYNDGTYTGTADGYRPGLVVEIVIKNDTIVSVTVIDHNEKNERFWGYPVEAVPQWIIEAQSTDVDTVSGATYTSRGIKNAVDDALSKALAN